MHNEQNFLTLIIFLFAFCTMELPFRYMKRKGVVDQLDTQYRKRKLNTLNTNVSV